MTLHHKVEFKVNSVFGTSCLSLTRTLSSVPLRRAVLRRAVLLNAAVIGACLVGLVLINTAVAAPATPPIGSAAAQVHARLGTRVLGQEVVIRISERGIDQSALTVGTETTVVWRNGAARPVRIEFVDQGPSATCNEPNGFELSPAGLSVSEKLHPGDTASVCFVEPRQYRYRVSDAANSAVLGEGAIKVTKTY